MPAPVTVAIAPQTLRWALARSGTPELQAAKKWPLLKDWLAGTAQPTLNQAEQFAHTTNTPFGLLFLPEPPEEPLPIPDMRTIRNTELSQPSGDLLDTIYACQTRQSWYKDYALEAGASPLAFVGQHSLIEDTQKIATQLITLLGFEVANRHADRNRQATFTYLREGIEALGVLVMISGILGNNTHRTLSVDEFRGFALPDPIAPLIFINGADSKNGQIFTLLHEFGHILLGGAALSDANVNASNGQPSELWCNALAGHILVPESDLKERYRSNTSSETLRDLADTFQTSTLVILRRLYDTHLLGWEQYQSLYRAEEQRIAADLKNRQKHGGGDYYRNLRNRLGDDFSKAVLASTREGRTLYTEAFRLLDIPKKSTFCRHSRGFRA